MFILTIADKNLGFYSTQIIATTSSLQTSIEENTSNWDEVKANGIYKVNLLGHVGDVAEEGNVGTVLVYSEMPPTETIILFEGASSLTIIAVEEEVGSLNPIKEWISNKICKNY